MISFFLLFNVTSDRYSLINNEILYNKKRQTGHWVDSIQAFLVSSVTRETLTYDVTSCTINQVPVTLSIYVLCLCTQEMPSFHFQIITLSKKFTLIFYPLCHNLIIITYIYHALINAQLSGEWPKYVIRIISILVCIVFWAEIMCFALVLPSRSTGLKRI